GVCVCVCGGSSHVEMCLEHPQQGNLSPAATAGSSRELYETCLPVDARLWWWPAHSLRLRCGGQSRISTTCSALLFLKNPTFCSLCPSETLLGISHCSPAPHPASHVPLRGPIFWVAGVPVHRRPDCNYCSQPDCCFTVTLLLCSKLG
ncbi:hypothetical protein XENOCAPTIV_021247, partial [Xenoophorus captivus]